MQTVTRWRKLKSPEQRNICWLNKVLPHLEGGS